MSKKRTAKSEFISNNFYSLLVLTVLFSMAIGYSASNLTGMVLLDPGTVGGSADQCDYVSCNTECETECCPQACPDPCENVRCSYYDCEVCEDGQCVSKCSSGFQCDDGRCQWPECTFSSDCDDGSPCTKDRCIGYTCFNTKTDACGDGTCNCGETNTTCQEDCAECTTSNDCSYYDCETCATNGTCINKCSAGMACDDGRCITPPDCYRDSDCDSTNCEECFLGKCVSGCEYNEKCVSGDCKYLCYGVDCGTCQTCDNSTGRCEVVPNGTRIFRNCESPNTCISGECVYGCSSGEVSGCGSSIGACVRGVQHCIEGAWSDCVGDIGPASEICDNRIDDDCDGTVDELNCGCQDGDRIFCGSNVGACKAGYRECDNGVWSDCINSINGTAEICDNDIDDDCDGIIDEDGCLCQDGEKISCGSNIGACENGTQTCINGIWGSCIGGVRAINELCGNGIDDDCDNTIDEGCVNETNTSLRVTCITEICDNRIDDDCDGKIDEINCVCQNGSSKSCGTNTGACSTGIMTCVGGFWSDCVGAIIPKDEICENKVDDDCDGMVDELEEAQSCIVTVNGTSYTVKLLGVYASAMAVVEVNGKFKEVAKGGTYVIAGLNVHVDEIDFNVPADEVSQARFTYSTYVDETQSKCDETFLSTYGCSYDNAWVTRNYVYENCTNEMVLYDYCSYGCSGGHCLQQTINETENTSIVINGTASGSWSGTYAARFICAETRYGVIYNGTEIKNTCEPASTWDAMACFFGANCKKMLEKHYCEDYRSKPKTERVNCDCIISSDGAAVCNSSGVYSRNNTINITKNITTTHNQTNATKNLTCSDGDLMVCENGTSECVNGQWGPCVSDQPSCIKYDEYGDCVAVDSGTYADASGGLPSGYRAPYTINDGICEFNLMESYTNSPHDCKCYEKNGVVVYEGEPKEDSCDRYLSWNIFDWLTLQLTDYYCDENNELQYRIVNCGNFDQVCRGGSCVSGGDNAESPNYGVECTSGWQCDVSSNSRIYVDTDCEIQFKENCPYGSTCVGQGMCVEQISNNECTPGWTCGLSTEGFAGRMYIDENCEPVATYECGEGEICSRGSCICVCDNCLPENGYEVTYLNEKTVQIVDDNEIWIVVIDGPESCERLQQQPDYVTIESEPGWFCKDYFTKAYRKSNGQVIMEKDCDDEFPEGGYCEEETGACASLGTPSGGSGIYCSDPDGWKCIDDTKKGYYQDCELLKEFNCPEDSMCNPSNPSGACITGTAGDGVADSDLMANCEGWACINGDRAYMDDNCNIISTWPCEDDFKCNPRNPSGDCI